MTEAHWRQIGIAAVYGIVIAVIAAFAHAALRGERGLGALADARAEAAALERRLEALEAERARLENRVSRLRTTSLDPDLLDERARAVLGYVRPDEIVLPPLRR
jgi:cell division protein FtsB